MSMDVDEKSAAAAAEAIMAHTFAIWSNRETAAQHAAQRAVAESGGSPQQQQRAGWVEHTEAFRSRGPVVWRLCDAPAGRRHRHWVLAPAVMESQATEREAHEAVARGDVVVLPRDEVGHVIEKLEAARRIRASLPNVA